MNYKVLIPRDIYSKYDSFKAWEYPRLDEHIQNDMPYPEFVKKQFPEIYECVESISDDQYYAEVGKLGPYDIIIGNNGKFIKTRYRLFTFHSQEHFVAYILKWGTNG